MRRCATGRISRSGGTRPSRSRPGRAPRLHRGARAPARRPARRGSPAGLVRRPVRPFSRRRAVFPADLPVAPFAGSCPHAPRLWPPPSVRAVPAQRGRLNVSTVVIAWRAVACCRTLDHATVDVRHCEPSSSRRHRQPSRAVGGVQRRSGLAPRAAGEQDRVACAQWRHSRAALIRLGRSAGRPGRLCFTRRRWALRRPRGPAAGCRGAARS